MLALAVVLTALAYRKGRHVPLEGLSAGVKMFGSILPVLIPAFIAAGMASVLIPADLLAQWMGRESGVRGMAMGGLVGAITPGGPFLFFPILAVLYQAGAGVGAITSFLSSWALLGLQRMFIFEVPIMGWKFALCRFVAGLIFPVLIGLTAQKLWDAMQHLPLMK